VDRTVPDGVGVVMSVRQPPAASSTPRRDCANSDIGTCVATCRKYGPVLLALSGERSESGLAGHTRVHRHDALRLQGHVLRVRPPSGHRDQARPEQLQALEEAREFGQETRMEGRTAAPEVLGRLPDGVRVQVRGDRGCGRVSRNSAVS
jgi:hypothetical protein